MNVNPKRHNRVLWFVITMFGLLLIVWGILVASTDSDWLMIK
jgi:hypothetical protein